MSSWRPDYNPDSLYFVTTTAVDHVHAFKRDVIKRLLLNTLDCMRVQQRINLFCFVIMPNHIHALVQCPPAHPIDDMMRDFKRHTTDRLIRQLRAEDNQKALDFFAAKVARPTKQTHKIWEDGYNAKEVLTAPFLTQKAEYIHNNPCQPHWNLSPSPEAYPWSSARFYLTKDPGIIPVDDVRRLLA